jgi:DNA end-binding protein Ku
VPATVWKGHLTFGLVSIPIKLYRAARAEKVSFRHVYRSAPASPQRAEPEPEPAWEPPPRRSSSVAPPLDKAAKLVPMRPAAAPPPAVQPTRPIAPPIETVERVRQAVLPQDEDAAPLQRSEIMKGYEYEKGRYVLFDQQELRNLTPETSREMVILEFTKLAEIDPIYYESSYYAAPDRGGERTYALLLEALRQTGYVGIAEVAMQRREHIVAIRPGRTGILIHTLYYPSEIHAEDEYRADASAVSPRELELARMLIERLAAPFDPTRFRDKYKERVEELITAKIEGREIARTETAPATPPVTDIMAALERSLAATAKKPATAETRTPVVEKKPKRTRNVR